MTAKEITGFLYENFSDCNLYKVRNTNNKEFCIFKNGNNEEYFVCTLNPTSDNIFSGLLHSLIDCEQWIEQNN